ncbi:MAG: PilZ domain-containing protein [Acidobacteriota bacterium]|nr:PilZ domain-containing protein [Acidobacteriota bacterium]MDH3783781.1 PilZ domain-containing protein [Acidobacteriota bacterium]
MKKPPANNRRDNRFLAGIKAQLILEDQCGDCHAEDLSRSGVLLTGAFKTILERDVRVRLEAVQGDLILELSGKIVHLHEQDDGETRVGIQFETPPEAVHDDFDALLARVVEGVSPAPIAALSPDASEEEIREALEQVPVAHRIQLARKADGDLRKILWQDRNYGVTEALLRNPHLTPPELMTMIRSPRLTPGALGLVADDPRWSNHDEVNMIIATHPRVNLRLAQRVVDRMTPGGQRQVLRRPGLADPIKKKLLTKFTTKNLQSW